MIAGRSRLLADRFRRVVTHRPLRLWRAGWLSDWRGSGTELSVPYRIEMGLGFANFREGAPINADADNSSD